MWACQLVGFCLAHISLDNICTDGWALAQRVLRLDNIYVYASWKALCLNGIIAGHPYGYGYGWQAMAGCRSAQISVQTSCQPKYCATFKLDSVLDSGPNSGLDSLLDLVGNELSRDRCNKTGWFCDMISFYVQMKKTLCCMNQTWGLFVGFVFSRSSSKNKALWGSSSPLQLLYQSENKQTKWKKEE